MRRLIDLEDRTSAHTPPTDESPMLVNTATQGDLLANLGTRRRSQENLCKIGFDAHNATASGRGADVNHQNLVLGEFLNLGLFFIISLDSE